jgi:hypothetical protein
MAAQCDSTSVPVVSVLFQPSTFAGEPGPRSPAGLHDDARIEDERDHVSEHRRVDTAAKRLLT